MSKAIPPKVNPIYGSKKLANTVVGNFRTKGMTLNGFCKKMGFEQSTVSRVLHGKEGKTDNANQFKLLRLTCLLASELDAEKLSAFIESVSREHGNGAD